MLQGLLSFTSSPASLSFMNCLRSKPLLLVCLLSEFAVAFLALPCSKTAKIHHLKGSHSSKKVETIDFGRREAAKTDVSNKKSSTRMYYVSYVAVRAEIVGQSLRCLEAVHCRHFCWVAFRKVRIASHDEHTNVLVTTSTMKAMS